MPARSLGHKSLLLTATTWSGSLLSMLVSILVARTLGPAALGSIGFSTGLVGVLMAVLLPGFAQAHLKRLAEGEDPGRCLGTMLAIQLALHGLLTVGVLAAWSAEGLFHSPALALVFLFLLAGQVANNFSDIFLKVFIAREWVVPHAIILLAARLARAASTVAVLLVIPSVVGVAATFMVDGLLSGLAAAVVLRARYGLAPRPPTRESVRAYWIYARPFLMNSPLALFQDSIDRVVVGRWAGLAAAGYYHVARALWEGLSSVVAGPATFLFTRLSSLFVSRSPDRKREARDFFLNVLDKLLFITVPLAFGFWAFAELGIQLVYGEAFLPAALPLRILVLAALVGNIVNPYTLALFAMDEVARFIPVNVLRLVVYAAALVILVPPGPVIGGIHGLWPGDPGAAVARLLLVLFPCWVYFRWARELAGLPLSGRVWAYLGGFGVMLGIFHALLAGGRVIGVTGWAAAIPAAGAALGLYLAYLFTVHPATGDNLRYALGLISPIGFIRFFRSGLRGPARP